MARVNLNFALEGLAMKIHYPLLLIIGISTTASARPLFHYQGQVFPKLAGPAACERQAIDSKVKLEATGSEIFSFGCRNFYKGNEIVGYQVHIEYFSEFDKLKHFEFKLAAQGECSRQLPVTSENFTRANTKIVDGYCVDKTQFAVLKVDYFQKTNTRSYDLQSMRFLPSFATAAACSSYVRELETTALAKGMAPIVSVCRSGTETIFYPDVVLGVVTGGSIQAFSEKSFGDEVSCSRAVDALTRIFEEFQFPVLDGYCRESDEKFHAVILYMDSFILPRLNIFRGELWRLVSECEVARTRMANYLSRENDILDSFCKENFGGYSPLILYVRKI